GGLLRYPEASQLLRYYLGWQAQKPTLRINSVIYEDSAVVKREMARQKRMAAAAMRNGGTESRQQSGKLLAGYPRLKYADNRFILKSTTRKVGKNQYETTWRVDNTYEFEGFRGTSATWKTYSKWSEFPVLGQKITIYDGLSKFLVDLHMAKEFKYYA